MPRSLPDVQRWRGDGALAVVGDRLATDLVDVTDDLSALDGEGFWAVVLPFDGVPVSSMVVRALRAGGVRVHEVKFFQKTWVIRAEAGPAA